MEPFRLVGPHARLEPARRVGVGEVDRGPVETDPGGDGWVPRRDGDVATRPTLEHDGRRAADASSRHVPALVAIEEQREPGAAADVDERQGTDVVGDETEDRGQCRAPTDLVGLGRSGVEQVGEARLVLGTELPEDRIRIVDARVGRQVRVVGGEGVPGLVEEQPVHTGEQQHGEPLLLRCVEQQPGGVRVVGDALGDVGVQRRCRGRARTERPEALCELIPVVHPRQP